MSQFDYISNSANGHAALDVLQNMLWKHRMNGDIELLIKNYRAGDPSALNAGQFYAPFMIQFQDGQRWIIFSTTSCRTDRIKGQQWDADNLKRLDPSIEKALLVYPDDTSDAEVRCFDKQKNKYDTGSEISRIDDISSHETLSEQISKRAASAYLDLEEEEVPEEVEDAYCSNESLSQESVVSDSVADAREAVEESSPISEDDVIGRDIRLMNYGLTDTRPTDAMDEASLGWQYDFAGKSFEKNIAELICNVEYLTALQNGQVINEEKFHCFKDMITTFGVDVSKVVDVTATAEKEEIELLPSGGRPKTDVVARFRKKGSSPQTVTISCKRTTRSYVSAHQYTADSFADVLDKNDRQLRKLLHVFQYYANAKDMPMSDRVALAKALRPHREKLCLWVLGGYGGDYKNPIQCADFLVTYNPEDGYFKTHTVAAYSKLLLDRKPLAFGTPFGWTYASKQRQQSIQLKMPIIR